MEKNMILCGVGGQGILSISYVICNAALANGWNFKQAEVHGMAQRGGAVQSHLRIADKPIASDLIPEGRADLILSVEPLEVFRYIGFLKPDGIIITSTVPYVSIDNYPDAEFMQANLQRLPHKILIDAKEIAQSIGSPKVQNIVILGAAAHSLGFVPENFDTALEELFGRKGEDILRMNKQAVRKGYELGLAGGTPG
ncbi:indolepyruvate oxidoreductase subunit beta [bacterium]|nr:indolepyruvate oxidoreductase subunit beta [candidate division CSSED10-310 bacterium]